MAIKHLDLSVLIFISFENGKTFWGFDLVKVRVLHFLRVEKCLFSSAYLRCEQSVIFQIISD